MTSHHDMMADRIGDRAVYVLGAGFTKAFYQMRHYAWTSSAATVSKKCSPRSLSLSN
jgi:hypothetical protein